MHFQQTAEIDRILGARRPTTNQSAAHDPARILKRLDRCVMAAAFAEEIEQFDEVGALGRHVDGDGPVGQAPEAARVEGAGNEFSEHGQAFLGPRIAGMRLGQDRETALGRAIHIGGNVDQGLMLQELDHIEIRESCVGPQLDIIAAGGGLGRDIQGHFHLRRRLAEIARQFRIEPALEFLGGQAFRRLQPDTPLLEIREQCVEPACKIKRIALAIGDRGSRVAVEGARMRVKGPGAGTGEQSRSLRKRVGQPPQPVMHRAVAIDQAARRRDTLERWGRVDLRIDRLGQFAPARREEGIGMRAVPGDGLEHGQPDFGLEQASGSAGQPLNLAFAQALHHAEPPWPRISSPAVPGRACGRLRSRRAAFRRKTLRSDCGAPPWRDERLRYRCA